MKETKKVYQRNESMAMGQQGGLKAQREVEHDTKTARPLSVPAERAVIRQVKLDKTGEKKTNKMRYNTE